MKKSKWLKFLALAFTCLSISAVATACGGGNTPSSSSSEDLSSSIEDSSSSSSDSSSSEDNTPANMYPEESLQFQKIAGKEEYRVVGLGNVSDLEIVIPSTYRGLPVTEIGEDAFYSSGARKATANITSVVIPDSVTSIGCQAFYYCESLTRIEIPDSVTSIGYEAFSRCDGLIIYCEAEGQPDGWDDGWNCDECLVVWDCKNNDVATDGYIYTTVDGIRYAVKDGLAIVARQSKNITVANIASSITYKGVNYTVTSIGNQAFYNCDNLTSIEIPNSVTSIGGYAFYNCSSLTGIEIPDSVTSIGDSAFSDCDNLQYTIKDNLKYLGNATNPYLYLGDTTSSDITSANIDDNCKFIGSRAFSDCSSLTSIEIPDSVTSIGYWAFYNCESLTSIVIPDSVTSIGYSAFYNCSSLTSIEIPDSVTSIGSQTFYNCNRLTSVVIPDSVTGIGNYAFYNCNRLTSIVIPDSVTSIGDYAFSDCYNLQYTIKDDLKYLGNATNPYLYLGGTTSSDITSANIDDNCKFIGDHAFYYCDNLTSVVIPNSVTSIGGYAFYNCSSLTSIVIPDSVTSIGGRAFSDCYQLTIYCEAESQPGGWYESWNYPCPVVWGYKGE